MTKSEVLKAINRQLVGKKITKIRYQTTKERREFQWTVPGIVIELEGSNQLVLMSDSEGNHPGCAFSSLGEVGVFGPWEGQVRAP